MDTFSMRTKILSGEGCLNYIKSLEVDNVCIVSDETMKKIGVLEIVTKVLEEAKITFHVFDSVEANPSLDTVRDGLHHIIKNKPEALIAVGGGSVIDAAKAIMYFCIKIKEELMDVSEIKKPIFVAIPTTSGTGSEVTSFSVITDLQTHTKIALTDSIMIPDVAILDARFTMSVPPFVTADTGMDVITHAIEAYVCNKAGTFSDTYAEKAMRLAFENLLRTYTHGEDAKARLNMHEASCMAGIAFNNSGLGINHSLAHVVGGRFNISHGRANAILLPHIIAFNSGLVDGTLEINGKAYGNIANLIGISLKSRSSNIVTLIELIRLFNKKMMIPSSFKDAGFDEQTFKNSIREMASIALLDVCTKTNPRKITQEDLEMLLLYSYQC